MNVSGDLAGLLLEYLSSHPVPAQNIQQRLTTFKPASRMTFRQWWGFLEQIQELYPNHLMGMELGKAIKPAHVGVLGYLTLSCQNVAEALQRFQRYQALLHDGDHAQLHMQGSEAVLRWDSAYGPSTQMSDEVLVMGMVNIVRRMTGKVNLQPSRVHFVCDPSQPEKAYQAYLHCPIRFNQPHLELAFPSAIFAWPVTNSDPALKHLLEQQAQALMAVLPQRDSFMESMQQAIVKAIEEGSPTLRTVANSLVLSPRTLHRRLHDRQLVFKHMLQQIRMQLARKYLAEQHLTLTEIALLLGYSEQSAFSRAFRSWFNQSPSQYQKQLLQSSI